MTRPPELHAWTSHHHPVPVPPGHAFPIDKYAPLVARLLDEGVVNRDRLHPSKPAPVEWLLMVHEPAYVERVLTGSLDDAEQRAIGLPWSGELVERARAGVYGTVEAARMAHVQGIAGNLAGGSHHAFRDRGEGYCLFNDLAIAIAMLRSEGLAARPFIADLDVHQGNGTAAIFASDASVFTYSIHAASNYPARKEAGDRDLSLHDGCGDDAYVAALESTLIPDLERHRPDVVLLQAGVDALAGDRFGRLALTHEGLARRDALVLEFCERLGVPVVVTLGGGYTRPPEPSIEAHANVWRAMRRFVDRIGPRVNGGDARADAVSAP